MSCLITTQYGGKTGKWQQAQKTIKLCNGSSNNNNRSTQWNVERNSSFRLQKY